MRPGEQHEWPGREEPVSARVLWGDREGCAKVSLPHSNSHPASWAPACSPKNKAVKEGEGSRKIKIKRVRHKEIERQRMGKTNCKE